MKFEMPNDYGIYLHDTPHQGTVRRSDRWISNGCVRLEDYRRFAGWVFGEVPQADVAARSSSSPCRRPVPVYLTYLTVAADAANGVMFRPDPYGFDAWPCRRCSRSGWDATA